MSLVLDDLPRDPDRLLLMLQQMAEVAAAERSRITALEIERDTVLAEREAVRTERDLAREERDAAQAEIEKLRLLIRQLKRGQFGRRSEKLDPDQLQLGLEDLEQTVAAAEAAQEEVAARNSTPRTPRVRRRNLGALPAHLPRVEVLVDVEDKSCPCCGGALHVIGEDTSEMLDIVPAQLRVKVIRRPRYGCRTCEEAVVQAPAPERPITGGMATEALLAHVLVAKYADFLPLYRQAAIFARQGIELDRSTLCDWDGRACWWLEPLWRLLRRHVMASTRIFADDTTLPVLDPGRGRTKTGRLWGYAIDDRPWGGETPPAVVFLYAEDRKGEHPAAHLAGFRGILQVDGYSGFKSLLAGRPPDQIKLAFCWAHTIRTQSKSRGWGRAGAGPRVAQRDDMLDLQAAVTDDDALDYQLQDRLPLGDAGRVQPGADAVAEAGQAGQRLIGVDPSLAQPAMLLMVLLGDAALLGQGTTLPGELLQADHLGLVGLQEAAVGTVEAVQSRPQPTPRELLAEIRRRALGQEPFELRPQLHGIAEQTRDVVPDHPFQDARLDARLGALALTARGEGTRARAAVVAPAAPTLVPGKVAAVDAQPAGAALQQAAQQVVVPLAVAEGRGRIAGQPVLDAVPGLLIDQGRHRDGDPLLRRPGTSRGPLAAAGRAAAGLLRHDVLEAVRVGGAGVDRVGEDVVDHRGRPLLTPRPGDPRAGVQPLHALADGQALLHHPRVELAHHVGLGLVDDQAGRDGLASGLVPVAGGRLCARDVPVARFLELAAPEALGQDRALVLGDGALDLQQELVVRVVGDRALQERDLAAGAAELLQEQDLVGVLAGQAVGAEHGDDVDGGVADRVAQAVQARPVEAGAAVTLVAEDVLLDEGMALGLGPGPQGGELAVDGLLAFLALGRDPSIDGGAHGSPPGIRDGARHRRGGRAVPLVRRSVVRGIAEQAAVGLIEPLGSGPGWSGSPRSAPPWGADRWPSGGSSVEGPPRQQPQPRLNETPMSDAGAARRGRRQ